MDKANPTGFSTQSHFLRGSNWLLGFIGGETSFQEAEDLELFEIFKQGTRSGGL